YDSVSMKTYSSPVVYRYCTSRVSMCARSTRSPARNVRSTTLPVRTFFRVVRTNAAPLPGLTCKNSTTTYTPSSKLMVMPLRKSLTDITHKPPCGACGLRRQTEQILRRFREHAAPVLRDDDQIFDPDAAPARQVHARLHAGNHARLQHDGAAGAQARNFFVDVETHAVAQPMSKVFPVAGRLDDAARRCVYVLAHNARLYRRHARQLRLQHQVVQRPLLGGGLADEDGAGHVRAVALVDAAKVQRHEFARRQRLVGRPRVRHGAVGPG